MELFHNEKRVSRKRVCAKHIEFTYRLSLNLGLKLSLYEPSENESLIVWMRDDILAWEKSKSKHKNKEKM